MRHYPRNSPQAAARLLALTMIADGNVSRSEIEAVRQLGIEHSLGLPTGGLGQVMQTLCEDLLQGGGLTPGVDEALLDDWLRDVDDPALQRRLLAAIAVAATADGHLAEAEQQVLAAMRRRWPDAADDLPATLALN